MTHCHGKDDRGAIPDDLCDLVTRFQRITDSHWTNVGNFLPASVDTNGDVVHAYSHLETSEWDQVNPQTIVGYEVRDQ
ncbi:hypothetical protein GPOL_c29020 [Gordonia polyisoprenivorans VH2]|uniref:Uncharacterized protein n=1 Tax=Gordonia polyisoprenivorans (strain DSM 44266 / VH2) TaxID=1112204 RepID=H6MTP4_GORPV|nr:hypothetical protein GPOL_c29020 [Gordonia polyisoprenivorans VH2]